MADKKYQPPEAEIERFIAASKSDLRTMAVAYLRARKRAREADMAFNLLSDLVDTLDHLQNQDGQSALSTLHSAAKDLRTYKQSGEAT